MINHHFWKDKVVFLTGHTGFKGSWLTLWLHMMGAKVVGYSLKPSTEPSLYNVLNIDSFISKSYEADIRDLSALNKAMSDSKPDIVIHMAAQPLVRESYRNPVETYSTNVMGTVHLLESVRTCNTIKAVVNVTTDKCYENKEWAWGYRENEALGGHDPYSNSKACSEQVASSYRASYFNPSMYSEHGVAVATARAGNVIGGGDWSEDRLIPDCLDSLGSDRPILIRNPYSIRPWQHVLEPLSGYLLLAQNLYEKGPEFGEAWNFGPEDQDAKPVEWIVNNLCNKWGNHKGYIIDGNNHPHEATFLKLDCSKAKAYLNWNPRWNLDHALDKIVEWTRNYNNGESMYEFSIQQINDYESSNIR